MDLANLKIVVDTKDLARATIELNKFAGDVTQAEARMAKARKSATDVHTETANRWISENRDIIATNRMVATAAREESLAVAGMDMAARRAAESKGILAKYSHQFMRTLVDLTPIISGLGLLTLAHGAIQATDAYTKLTSQLKTATNSTSEYAFAMSEVKRISSAAQVDINAIGSLYQRLSLATQASGTSQKEVALITETVSLGLKANGASARESASAMLQLSQSFGSGRMAGEEFNSMAEAAPNVLRALAVSMGVPYGMLKGLAAEGKITTEVMTKAFTDPALLAAFQAQAASMRTITGSWVELTNALVLYVGESSKSSGVVNVLSGALSFLADNLKLVANALMFITGVMAMNFIAVFIELELAIVANTRSLALNAITTAELARENMVLATTDALLTGNSQAATAARIEYLVATKAATVAQGELTAATITWGTTGTAAITSIGVALRAAAMAHPITAAALAIGTIIIAIANWESVTSGAKATFNWFKNDFLGGFEFLAKGVGISLGELVQKMSLLSTVTVPQLKSGEFKKQWDELGKIAEQSRIESAAGIAGVDMRTGAQIEEANKKLLVSSTDAWNKLHQTKEQQRAADISALNDFYLKEVSARGLSQDVQIKLAEEYQVKLGIINGSNKYKTKEPKEEKIHQSRIETIGIEMEANSRSTFKELSNVEKLAKEYQKLDWDKMDGIEKITAMNDWSAAAKNANLADERKAADDKLAYDTEMIQKRYAEENAIWVTLATNTQQTLSTVFLNGFNGTFTGVGEMFKQMLFKMAADAAAADLSKYLFSDKQGSFLNFLKGLGGNNNEGLGGNNASLISQEDLSTSLGIPFPEAHAIGGPVSANSPYIVGERGPELFVPRNSGTIVPNGQSGGITINDNTVINVDSRSDRASVLSDISKLIDGKQAMMLDKLQRQRRLA